LLLAAELVVAFEVVRFDHQIGDLGVGWQPYRDGRWQLALADAALEDEAHRMGVRRVFGERLADGEAELGGAVSSSSESRVLVAPPRFLPRSARRRSSSAVSGTAW
jgi:hypothetical protein